MPCRAWSPRTHSRYRVSEPGLERGIARDAVAGGTLREAATDDDIFDLGGSLARPGDGRQDSPLSALADSIERLLCSMNRRLYRPSFQTQY